MAHQHQNEQKFPSLFDALYCEEEHWEEVDREDCFIEEEESFCAETVVPRPTFLLEQDFLWEEEELCSLFTKEQENALGNELHATPGLAEARREAVEWILKVTAYYYFSAGTALLAVNYLDRFLFNFQSQGERKPWMTQLAAVACLSLAAKVEETQVPVLLNLQVEESKYLFEAKTIQRMEILVLSTLQWKMNSVTPLSFIDYMTRRLGLKNHICLEFLKRCECLLLSIITDCRFKCTLPSVMATATMMHVFSGVELYLGLEYQEQLFGILGIDKDKVEDCYRLISEVASTTSRIHPSNKRKFLSLPGSPKGVMDVSFSSDCSSESWSVASSVSSSPEPLSKSKRSRAEIQDQLGQGPTHGTPEIPNIR